jgi:hypothetical protein
MNNKFLLLKQKPYLKNFFEYLDFGKKIGFFLQVGVGDVINYPGRDELLKRGVNHYTDKFVRLPSNTTELLELGWRGVYVDPVSERLRQCLILHKDRLQNLKLINHAVSEKQDVLYSNYYKKYIKSIQIDSILKQFCPQKIDLLNISVGVDFPRIISGIDFSLFKFNMIIIDKTLPGQTIDRKSIPDDYIELYGDEITKFYINKHYK